MWNYTLAGSDLLALINEGISQSTNGNKSVARFYFQKALEIDKNNETALLWMAWNTEDPYESVKLYERILTNNPRNAVAQAYLRSAKARQEVRDNLVMSSNTQRLLKRATGSLNRKQATKVVPFLGEYLVRQGYITHQQLESALRHHQQSVRTGKPRQLGQSLMELGYLSKSQLDQGIQRQREEYGSRYLVNNS